MAKSLLIILMFLSMNVHADLFDFDSEKPANGSKIPVLIEKLKGLDMKDDPAYEESFNAMVKAIENGVEEEKLYCSGEATDHEGKTLPADKKQLCMRELKKQYIEATMTIFDIKKKYLGFIHQKQLERLTEIQNKLKSDIEKKF
ncbi:MAG: hypothetical protein ACLGHN_04235 [Bacteriovoracia bacterium]